MPQGKNRQTPKRRSGRSRQPKIRQVKPLLLEAATERRYPLLKVDDAGHTTAGEVWLLSEWRSDLAAGLAEEGLGFRIIILSESLPDTAVAVGEPGIAVCLPAEPLSLSPQVREAAVAYAARGFGDWQAPEGLPSLPDSAIQALAQGRIVASDVDISPQGVFRSGWEAPDFSLLSSVLTEAVRGYQAELQRYITALASAIPSLATSYQPSLSMLLTLLQRQIEAARPAINQLPADVRQHVDDTVSGLAAVSQAESPWDFVRAIRQRYASQEALVDGAALCRLLPLNPQGVAEVARRQRYLDGAVVPETFAELALDRQAVEAQASYASLMAQPHLLAAFTTFYQSRFWQPYQATYLEHHRRYWQSAAWLRKQLRDAASTARALRNLDSIAELGPAVGEESLVEYEFLLVATARCTVPPQELALALPTAPRCLTCNVSLADSPPASAVEATLADVRRACETQLQRLSSRLARRIMSRSYDSKVEQVLQLAAAGDLSGLVNVLDDEAVAFLRRLLSAPTVTVAPILERIRQAYEQVSEEDLEPMLAEMRRLVREALASSQEGGNASS